MRWDRLLLSLMLTGGVVLTACATSSEYVQRTYRTEGKTAAEVDADMHECWNKPQAGGSKRDAYRQCMEEKGYRIDFSAGNKYQESGSLD